LYCGDNGFGSFSAMGCSARTIRKRDDQAAAHVDDGGAILARAAGALDRDRVVESVVSCGWRATIEFTHDA
jgi:hypothetical protein